MGIHYEQTARVYRFGGAVAMDTENGSHIYLSPKLAKELGEALIACAKDVRLVAKFPESTFPTTHLSEGP